MKLKLKLKIVAPVAAIAMTALGTIGLSSEFAAPAGASGDVCVSVHGATRVSNGASQCFSDSTSKAVAVNNSIAFSAIGGGGQAVAVNGSNATGVSDGQAVAVNGSQAIGEFDGQAIAVNGSTAVGFYGGQAVAVNRCSAFTFGGKGHCHG